MKFKILRLENFKYINEWAEDTSGVTIARTGKQITFDISSNYKIEISGNELNNYLLSSSINTTTIDKFPKRVKNEFSYDYNIIENSNNVIYILDTSSIEVQILDIQLSSGFYDYKNLNNILSPYDISFIPYKKNGDKYIFNIKTSNNKYNLLRNYDDSNDLLTIFDGWDNIKENEKSCIILTNSNNESNTFDINENNIIIDNN